MKNPKGADFRWLQELEDYQFPVRQRLGRLNMDADQLSQKENMPEEEEVDKEVAGLVIQHIPGEGGLPPGII